MKRENKVLSRCKNSGASCSDYGMGGRLWMVGTSYLSLGGVSEFQL
jgi:hypothetical protein